jgi:hypothetical protein
VLQATINAKAKPGHLTAKAIKKANQNNKNTKIHHKKNN